MSKPKTLTALQSHVRAIYETAHFAGVDLMKSVVTQSLAVLKDDGIPAKSDMLVASKGAKASASTIGRINRVMRTLAEVTGKARASRAATLCKFNLLDAERVCAENKWGLATTGKGNKSAGGSKGGRPKGTAKPKEPADGNAMADLRKISTARLIEWISAKCAKSPDFRAKLLQALNAETTDADADADA